MDTMMPTLKERIARMLVAGVFACGIGASGITPLCAFADEGSVTITQHANESATYDVYQLFTADIADDDVATHIAWNTANRDTVLAFLLSSANGAEQSYADWLASHGLTDEHAAANAQNAAEYMAAMISSSSTDLDAGTVPGTKLSGSFAENLAQALASGGVRADPATASSGSPYVAAEGYYLFVTSPSSIGEGESGTAPMWIPLGGSIRTIDAKEFAPTVTFQVMEDRDGSAWGLSADSHRGQDLDFRIEATLPGNIGAYDHFHDRYTVTIPLGMELSGGSTESVSVAIGSSDVTDEATISYDGQRLVIEIADVKQLDAATNRNTNVVVQYQAHLSEGATTGEAGNTSTLVRTYTHDPITLSDGDAPALTVRNYTYQANVLKVDKSNKTSLGGARYTVRASNGAAADKTGAPTATAPAQNTDSGSAGYYVQADGSLGNEPHEFVTNDAGELTLPTIDEGVYVIRETAAPNGYDLQDSDAILTIESSIDQSTGALASLEANLSGGEAIDVDGDEMTHVASVDRESGIVTLVAADDRLVELAATGLAGNGGLLIAAGILAGTGTAGLAIAGRKRDGRR